MTPDPTLILRGLASLIIVWVHVLPPTDWLIVSGVNLYAYVTPSGMVALYVFYLLSGYGIGYGFFSGKYTLQTKSLVSFFINRILRIAPAYYVSLLLCIFVFYPRTSISSADVIRFFTFTANFHHFNLPYQNLLAVISTEMQFYVVSPLLFVILYKMLRKIHPAVIALVILLTGIAARYFLSSMGLESSQGAFMENVYVMVWGTLDFFLFGMFLSYLVINRAPIILSLEKRIPQSISYSILGAWFIWANYSLANPDQWQNFPQYLFRETYILPATLCLVVGWVIVSKTVHWHQTKRMNVSPLGNLKLFTTPATFLSGIGFFSYGIYLYHYIAFTLIYKVPGNIKPGMGDFLIRFIVVSTIALAAAILSYSSIDYPLTRFKRKSPDRQNGNDAH